MLVMISVGTLWNRESCSTTIVVVAGVSLRDLVVWEMFWYEGSLDLRSGCGVWKLLAYYVGDGGRSMVEGYRYPLDQLWQLNIDSGVPI